MGRYRNRLLAAGVLAGMLAALPLGGALAYMTCYSETVLNPFTVALDSTTAIVERYPEENRPVPDGNTIDYGKAVQVGNTGYIDCYVRVTLDFTDSDIMEKSMFSADGTNWYTIGDYRNHLPEGWVYDASDGFYYYTPILYAEKWDETSADFSYWADGGEYFYQDGAELKSATCLTTPLIRYVKTAFTEPKDMRSYSVNVYDESVPAYFGNDYRSAWTEYLAATG